MLYAFKLVVFIIVRAMMIPLAHIERWALTARQPLSEEAALDRLWEVARREGEAYRRERSQPTAG